jgi:zinc transport system substrate-binding protein
MLALAWAAALPAAASGVRLKVVVSVAPHAWLVERIGGGTVEVMVLVDPGESPATYQPTDVQVTRLLGAAIYFRTGVPFENGPWLRALRRAGRLEIVDLRDGIELRRTSTARVAAQPGSHRSADSGGDPHIWLSPRLLQIQARTIVDRLGARQPEWRPRLEANLVTLAADLAQLDSRIRSRLEPFRGRAFLVFHPSWGYFADDYGLRQVPIEIEGKSPADRDLTVLAETARAERAVVVFVQPQISGRGAAAVAATVGARLEMLDPLAFDVLANLDEVSRRLRESFE